MSDLKSPSCIFAIFRRLPVGILEKFRTMSCIGFEWVGMFEIRGVFEIIFACFDSPHGGVKTWALQNATGGSKT